MKRTLIAIVVAMLLAPASNLFETSLSPGGGTAEAAPRKAKGGKAKRSKAGKAKSAKANKPKKGRKAKRSKAVARGSGGPVIDVTDDTTKPLEEAWKTNVQRWLNVHRPQFGSFVAIEPATGQILVMAERSANPGRIPHPALAAAFPAASIFKIVTAAALLANGVRPEATACYSGGLHGLDETHIRDNPRRDRACKSLALAFAGSTNAVFGKLALRHLNPERLLAQSERLGFNRNVSVDGMDVRSKTTRAAPGLDLARMAAGFVNSNLSPLHGAVIAATIANGGRLPSGASIAAGGSGESALGGGAQVLEPAVAAALRDMMARTSVEGTGRKHLAGFATLTAAGGVAVKTGTLTSRDGSGVFNTWMVGFYPARKPEIAFAAHVGTAGPGPIKAGHLTRFAINAWRKLKKSRAGQS